MIMKQNNKAQGLSLNTIIIAALVLVVLIILIVVFSGRMNLFGDAYDSTDDDVSSNICMKDGYMCMSPETPNGNDCPTGTPKAGSNNWIDCSDTQVCCSVK